MKTVADLMDELARLNPDLIVIQASDDEGTNFFPFQHLTVGDNFMSSDLPNWNYGDEDKLIKAVILWP